jgi:carbon-monoxide dehydrogenase medium subunit
MLNFEYYAPRSLKEALALLEKHGAAARVLAGGTDLMVQMKDGRERPAVIVDVKHIPELNRLDWPEGQPLFIGAAVPLSQVAAFSPIMERLGILHQACSLIGSVQIRNRGTVGGNICNAAPSADSPPPLLCLGAAAVVAGPKGTRKIPLESFFRGPGQTALTSGELLVGIEVPAPPASSAGCYLRLTPREEMDISVAGVASFVVFEKQKGRCREARIAIGAVAPTPIRVPQAEAVLAGQALTDDVIEATAEKAAGAARPISDVRGSAEYRREMVRALTRRTLQRVREAAGSSH